MWRKIFQKIVFFYLSALYIFFRGNLEFFQDGRIQFILHISDLQTFIHFDVKSNTSFFFSYHSQKSWVIWKWTTFFSTQSTANLGNTTEEYNKIDVYSNYDGFWMKIKRKSLMKVFRTVGPSRCEEQLMAVQIQ